MNALARAELLSAHAAETAACTACGLAATRGAVIVGHGAPDADLMLVAEAPRFRDERDARPLAGDAGELLTRLLGEHGLDFETAYLTTIVKCRPPAGRDPSPEEIAACERHLFRQIELVRPRVVATLGTAATQLLTGRELSVTRVHGVPHEVVVGSCPLIVLPLYHPAAALYTPTMLRVLEEDVRRIPELLGSPGRASSAARAAEPEPERPVVDVGVAEADGDLVQLGLF